MKNKGQQINVVSITILLTVILISIVMFAQFVWTEPTKAEPIKIGVLFSETGPVAFIERYMKRGGMFLIEKVNKEGGIKGRLIKPIIYDNESKPDLTTTLSKKLILQDKVVAIFGPGITPLHVPASALAYQYKIPMVSPGGTIDAIPKEYYSYNFVCWANGHLNAQGLIYYFRSENKKRIGILGTADPVGEQIKTIKKYVQLVGNMEIVAIEMAPPTAKELTIPLAKIKANNIDVLLVVASGPFATIAMNTTVQVGLNIPIGYIGANCIPELIRDVVPEAANNVRICLGKITAYQDLKDDDPVKPQIVRIAKEFRDKFGDEPNLVDAVGYDTALHLIDALKAVGPDSQKIRDYIENGEKNQLGLVGSHYNMNAQDHMGANIKEHLILKISGGKFRLDKYISNVITDLKTIGIKPEE